MDEENLAISLTCPLCVDQLTDPVVWHCCAQATCKECLISWHAKCKSMGKPLACPLVYCGKPVEGDPRSVRVCAALQSAIDLHGNKQGGALTRAKRALQAATAAIAVCEQDQLDVKAAAAAAEALRCERDSLSAQNRDLRQRIHDLLDVIDSQADHLTTVQKSHDSQAERLRQAQQRYELLVQQTEYLRLSAARGGRGR